MRRFIWIIVLMMLSAMPVSAQEVTPEYVRLTTIAREPLRVYYQPEYFAFSPDGSRIAAAATEDNVNVWDVDTGEVIHVLEHPSISVTWSPDGAWIAAGGGTNTRSLQVWEASTGALRHTLPSVGEYAAFSPDSTQFVTVGGEVFDISSGEMLTKVEFNWGVAYKAEWRPDGAMFAIASGWEGSDTQLWSADGEHIDSLLTGPFISWSPDSTRLASIGQVRRIDTGLPEATIPEMGSHVSWHPSEEWIASAKGDTVRLWDARNGDLLAAWAMPRCDIRGFAWSGDGNRFAANCFVDGLEFPNYLVIWERVR